MLAHMACSRPWTLAWLQVSVFLHLDFCDIDSQSVTLTLNQWLNQISLQLTLISLLLSSSSLAWPQALRMPMLQVNSLLLQVNSLMLPIKLPMLKH